MGLPAWVAPVAFAGSLLVCSWWEGARPLRRRVEPRGRHLARNVAVGALAYACAGAVHVLALAAIAAWAQGRGLGILGALRLPGWLELVAGVLLLDWMLWGWHLLNHRVPLLWRFHAVHHVDLDLDASTGLRFHFGELVLSAGVRSLQLLVIGPTALAFGLWQTLLFASIFFHHGNMRLPIGVERVLVAFIATPRMHGIHHSRVREERDANYASLFTVWDRIHGTLRLDVPQDSIVIGVPGFEARGGLTLGRILLQPFGRQRAEDRARARAPATGSKARLVA